METSIAYSAYDGLIDALSAQRCVILDGKATAERRDVLEDHRRYVQAGCDVITATTPGLSSAHWMKLARRSIKLARQAIADEGREGEVAVAFSIGAGPHEAETIRLLSRALADEPPDLVLFEGLTVVGPALDATVGELLATGLPLWLSFSRCRHGLCGVYGQHWGGPEGDAFGRAARRFEEMGAGALLVGCIPPDHVDGMVSYLRDFTDLPLGVAPNLGYHASDGWRADGDADYAGMALRWREEGAQIVGGCCGVSPEDVAAARGALAGTEPGARRSDDPAGERDALVPAPWRDAAERSLYPLPFPDLVLRGGVFLPSQSSFMIWRHLFNEQVGRGARCLDIGCGSGLQSIQLALNGAERVRGIDLDPEAVDVTLVNAFRNGVADRVSAAATSLYQWVPEERYDVIVASLFQTPVHPLDAMDAPRPADYWGRNAVDHVIGILPRALAAGGVAYVLQVSILSQQDTADLLERHGLQARVADFAIQPMSSSFRRSAEQIARVEQLSDAYHLEIAGNDFVVGYLLEITHR